MPGDTTRPAPAEIDREETDRRRTGFAADGRGVSEVLGFVLAFSIIITSTALVFTVGFELVKDFQNDQQDENAEGTFVRMARKFGEVENRQAPRRAGEISVLPGQMGIERGGEMEVAVSGLSGSPTTVSETFELNGLVYRNERVTVEMEGTGIFRSDRGASTVTKEPNLFCDPGRQARITVSTLVLERNATAGSVSGEVVTVIADHANTTLWYPENRVGRASPGDATTVEVDVSSRHSEAWASFFERASGWEDVDGDGAFECELGPDGRVTVRHVFVGIRFV